MITIILGMHRSGTSVVAGILHFNKVIMGTYETFWPRPLPQNPKGIYENYDFRKINDAILFSSGYNVKDYKPNVPVPKIIERSKMIKTIQKYESNFKNWGWKDPRTCLTISNWMLIFEEMELLEKLKIIFVLRSPLAVARSLKKRNTLPLKDGISLWETYNRRAINFCESNNIPTIYLSFEEILKKPVKQCKKLFKFLSLPFDKSVIKDFVDKDISTNDEGEPFVLSEDILALENKIEKLTLL